jgi:hypothetical protein
MPDASINTDIDDIVTFNNVDNNVDNNTDNNENTAIKKLKKMQDSLRKAKNKYCKKRYAEDPEFRKKQIEQIALSQKKNPEKYKEYKKNYMREYRAKKKSEAAATITAAIPEQQPPIKKQSEHCHTETIEATTVALEALALSRE